MLVKVEDSKQTQKYKKEQGIKCKKLKYISNVQEQVIGILPLS